MNKSARLVCWLTHAHSGTCWPWISSASQLQYPLAMHVIDSLHLRLAKIDLNIDKCVTQNGMMKVFLGLWSS